MAQQVIALKNFDYPGDPKVRDAIAAFHKAKKNDGVSWPGDKHLEKCPVSDDQEAICECRGESVEVSIGDVIDAPEDCLDHWLAEELVLIPIDEEVGSDG